MLLPEEWMNLHVLSREGHTIKSLVRLTGHARNTVRKMLRTKEPPEAKVAPGSSRLDPFKPYLEKRCAEACGTPSIPRRRSRPSRRPATSTTSSIA